MGNTSEGIENSSGESLSRLLGLENQETGWREEELGAVLEHQLSASLESLRHTSVHRAEEDCGGATDEVPETIATFRELLHHPNPPLELLKRTKTFARDARMSCGGPLPDAVAAVLYYASIMLAFNRHGERISALSKEDLERGVQGVMKRPWLGENHRELLRRELRAFLSTQDDTGE
ncbi:MAG: hypothetical protein ACOCSQ_04615 [Planctomycetota bacterium]